MFRLTLIKEMKWNVEEGEDSFEEDFEGE